MNRFLRSVFSCLVVCASLGMRSTAGRADDFAEGPRLPPAKLVEETLRREANQAIDDRGEMLRPAITQGRRYDPAYWLSGFIFDSKAQAMADFVGSCRGGLERSAAEGL